MRALGTVVSFLALAVSSVSLYLTVGMQRRDPLGNDLSHYDLSSPEKSLRSFSSMISNQDVKAGLELLKSVLQDGADTDMKVYFTDPQHINVVKSIEVAGSGRPKNNGTIVSFVKFTVAGVDYNTVQYFHRDESGRFRPSDPFYEPIGPPTDPPTEKDKEIAAQIESFKKSGKL
jgi:hypothetical protein